MSRLAGWIEDVQEDREWRRWFSLLLFGLAFLVVWDTSSTTIGLQMGYTELNPFVLRIFEIHGPIGLLLLHLTYLSIGVAQHVGFFHVKLRNYPKVKALLLVVYAGYLLRGLTGYYVASVHNTYTLLTALF